MSRQSLLTVARTLVEAPRLSYLAMARSQLQFFADVEPRFAELVGFVERFHAGSGDFPGMDAIRQFAALDAMPHLEAYAQEAVESGGEPASSDAQFHVMVSQAKRFAFDSALTGIMTEMSASPDMEGYVSLSASLSELVQSHASPGSSRQSTTVYGRNPVERFKERYDAIVESRAKGDILFMDAGLDHFSDMRFRAGDLVIVSGFTSHGKSIWLRHFAYRLATHYGLNCAFFTLEVPEEILLTQFYLMHANNKAVFPDGLPVSFDAYSSGALSDDEYSFVTDKVIPDLAGNPNYGTLHTEQPALSRFTVQDLAARIRDIDATTMRVDAVFVDYMRHMSPMVAPGRSPTRDDINDMFKDFKALCLSHRDRSGASAPMVGFTAAQVSRLRLEEAQKNDGVYNILASSEYTEIERSADLMFTTYFPPEYREQSMIRLQAHKNRTGSVPMEPADVHIDLRHGQFIANMDQHSPDDMAGILRSIAI